MFGFRTTPPPDPRPDLFAIFAAIDAYEVKTWELAAKSEYPDPNHPDRIALRREWTTMRRALNDLIRAAVRD